MASTARPAPGAFYRRQLASPPSIAFTSAEGRRIFGEALASGTLECFFPLIEQVSWCRESALAEECGVAQICQTAVFIASFERKMSRPSVACPR